MSISSNFNGMKAKAAMPGRASVLADGIDPGNGQSDGIGPMGSPCGENANLFPPQPTACTSSTWEFFAPSDAVAY